MSNATMKALVKRNCKYIFCNGYAVTYKGIRIRLPKGFSL